LELNLHGCQLFYKLKSNAKIQHQLKLVPVGWFLNVLMNCQWQSLLCQVEDGVLNMFGEEIQKEEGVKRSPQYTVQLRGCEVLDGADTERSYRITLSMLGDQVAVLEVNRKVMAAQRDVQKLKLVDTPMVQLRTGSETNLVSAGKRNKRTSFRQSLAICTERAQVGFLNPLLRRTASAKNSLRRTPSALFIEHGKVFQRKKVRSSPADVSALRSLTMNHFILESNGRPKQLLDVLVLTNIPSGLPLWNIYSLTVNLSLLKGSVNSWSKSQEPEQIFRFLSCSLQTRTTNKSSRNFNINLH
ncbi:hypothetical protein GOODEAATRI_026885, partial [Goodea atripinnis]